MTLRQRVAVLQAPPTCGIFCVPLAHVWPHICHHSSISHRRFVAAVVTLALFLNFNAAFVVGNYLPRDALQHLQRCQFRCVMRKACCNDACKDRARAREVPACTCMSGQKSGGSGIAPACNVGVDCKECCHTHSDVPYLCRVGQRTAHCTRGGEANDCNCTATTGNLLLTVDATVNAHGAEGRKKHRANHKHGKERSSQSFAPPSREARKTVRKRRATSVRG